SSSRSRGLRRANGIQRNLTMRFVVGRGWKSKWLSTSRPKRREQFRPMLERLEDRTLPDASGLPAAAVNFLRTPTGQVVLGELISQAQGGPIVNNPLGQAVVTVNLLTALGLPPLQPPNLPPLGGLPSSVDFFRTPAGLIFLGQALDQSEN